MFDDILGEVIEKDERPIDMSSDSRPTSFSEVWAAKQRQIDAADGNDDDDFTEEYECLQV